MNKTFLLIGLTTACLLAGCAPGRWEVKDLSSYSYSFGPAAAHKPFAPRDAKRFQPASWSAVQPIQ